MKFIRGIDKVISAFEKFIIAVSVILMSVLLIGNALSRIMNHSWAFTDEIGQFLLIFLTFIGASYASRIGRHIRMEGLFDLLPHRFKKILMVIISFFTFIVMFALCYESIRYVLYEHKLGQLSVILQVPFYLILISVPIGFLLSGISYLRNFYLNIAKPDLYISPEKVDDRLDIHDI